MGAAARIRAIATQEFRGTWRKVSTWVLLAILLLFAWGFVAGNVTVATGSGAVGGERPHFNSMFNIAQTQIVMFTLFYVFFVAIAFGMAILEDDNARVGPLIHATPLSAREYVWGRYLGQLVAYVLIIAAQVGMLMLFMQFYPQEQPERVRGAFLIMNYAWPTLLFVVVPVIFFGGVSLALGSISRHAMLVFLLPVATLLACAFLLWSFSPEWLPQWTNRLLQAVDPTGLRWLSETYLKSDRGASYYNATPIGLDALIVANRVALIVLGLGAVGIAAFFEERRLRGGHRVTAATIASAIAGEPQRRPSVSAPAVQLPSATQSPPARLATFRAGLVCEARELRRAPGLFLFVPLIVLQVISNATFLPGAFETPRLLTAGGMAAATFNTTTLLSTLLLLFYVTESLARDEKARTVPIVLSSGSRIGALVAARLVANCVIVLGAVLGGVYGGVCLSMLVQFIYSDPHQWVTPSPGPFLFVWTFFLMPTVLAWLGYIALAWSITRNRFAVYGLGLAALIATGWCAEMGWMNWVFNWHFWDVVRWTDFGPFELDRLAIVLNRIMWTTVAIALFAIAVRIARLRTPDPHGAVVRRRPWRIVRAALPLAPLVVVPIVLGCVLGAFVQSAIGGAPSRRAAKDYWRKNVNTWRDVKQPFVDELTLDLTLDPATSSFRISGTYVLRNPDDAPIDRFALTPSLFLDDLTFGFEETSYRLKDDAIKKPGGPVFNSAGLWIFTPTRPLAKDETTKIDFSYEGRVPRSIHRNASGADEFILPSGVVLNSFSPSILPLVGMNEAYGLEPENQPEPRIPMRDEWKKRTRPAFGYGAQTNVTARITLPSEYRANCPGVLESDEVITDGYHVMTWKTDAPIRFFNVVAGKWVEHKGETTSIWCLPAHERNIASMTEALDAARKYYSQWFHPYPWKDLRLSEFPGLAGYAQGFGTNIVFSEGIGFLARATTDEDAPFLITAHEAAHQWWGNILMPGDGPGGNILSEGLAHFSTARLFGEVRGERARQAFLREIEHSYQNSRAPDDERPLVEIDGTRNGDTTVTYDKGGWVFWMLMDLMGREACDAGLRGFIAAHKDGPDYPLLQDFVETMRDHAPDREAFDKFVAQWFFDVVVPEFSVDSATTKKVDGKYVTHFVVRNKGTGRVPVEVAVTNDEDRWGEDSKQSELYRELRGTVTLGAGESEEFDSVTDFEPKKVVVDPDVRVLQLRRKQAVADVTSAEP